MRKTQLNLLQISGLIIFFVSLAIYYFFESKTSDLLILLSAIIVLLGSKVKPGVIISSIIIVIGTVFLKEQSFGIYIYLLGLLGLAGCGFRQIFQSNNNTNLLIIFLFILIFILSIVFIHNNRQAAIGLLVTGTTGVVLAYTYRFLNKPAKNTEDFLKLFIVYTFAGFIYSLISHSRFESYFLRSFYILLFLWTILSLTRIIRKQID